MSLLGDLYIGTQPAQAHVLQGLRQQLVRSDGGVVNVRVVVRVGLPEIPTGLAVGQHNLEPVGILRVEISCKRTGHVV